MGRSLKKGPFVDAKLLKKVERLTASGKKEPIKTWARRSTVTPEFVGHTFLVHDGRRHLPGRYLVRDRLHDRCDHGRLRRGVHGGAHHL